MKNQPEKIRYMSSYELISLYINDHDRLEPAALHAIEAEFHRRKLPLPRLPSQPEAQAISTSSAGAAPVQLQTAPLGADPALPAKGRPAASKRTAMDRRTFISYLLLIFSGTAVVYAWFFIPLRLAKRDYLADRRNFRIQAGVSVFYMALDFALFFIIKHALRR